MTCNHCGATVNEGAAFCQNCGQPVSQPVEPVSQPAAPQTPYQNQYQQPYQNPYGQEGSPVKQGAYLAWSIVVTVLCCWGCPFGIPAIVNAVRIGSCNQRGDFAGAEEAARKSKTWTIVAACVGFVLGVLASVFSVLGGYATYVAS